MVFPILLFQVAQAEVLCMRHALDEKVLSSYSVLAAIVFPSWHRCAQRYGSVYAADSV